MTEGCDDWGECTVRRFASRFVVAGGVEFDPRRPLHRRLLDPPVRGAALAGAAFATPAVRLVA